jgi:hypothetical protein
MTRALKPVRMLGSVVKKVGKAIATFGAVAAAGALVGMTLMVRKSLAMIDATGKLADRINSTTESIIGLRHAAELAGVSAGDMDKALEKLMRGIGELEDTAGTASFAIKAMGLDANELKKLGGAEMFREIVEELGKIENATMRSTRAYQLFGRKGQALINLVLGGIEGLDAARADAEAIGLMFSRIDAKQVEIANDALFRMKQSFVAIGQQAAIKLAPLIAATSDLITKWVSQANIAEFVGKIAGGIEKVIRWAVQAMGRVVLTLISVLEKAISAIPLVDLDLTEEWLAVSSTFFTVNERMKHAFDGVREKAEEFTAALKDQKANAITPLQTSMIEQVATLQRQIDTFGMSAQALRLYTLEQQVAAGGAAGLSAALLEQVTALYKQLDALKAAAEMQRKGEALTKAMRTPMETYTAALADYNAMLEAGVISWETYGRAVAKARGQLEGVVPKEVGAPTAPRALVAGSAEEISMRIRHTMGGEREDQLTSIAESEEQSVDLLSQIQKEITRVRESLEVPGTVVV